jgi:2-C-methyl-D-erythritol 4-phosphate cytidylyltransferase
VGGTWCIVVGGGSGRRFGGAKQFELLGGERVVDRSVRIARTVCEGVVVVVPAAALGTAEAAVAAADSVVAGGTTRAESVRAGLAAVPADAEVVLVHDAARPLATTTLYRRVVDAVRAGAEVVVPAVPVVDTIRAVSGGVVDREGLRAVQTPQGFDAAVLRRVHAEGGEGTDDAGLAEAAGSQVVLVEGERTNLKLTGPEDRLVATALLAWLEAEPGAPDPE